MATPRTCMSNAGKVVLGEAMDEMIRTASAALHRLLIIDQDIEATNRLCEYVSRFRVGAVAVTNPADGIATNVRFFPDVVLIASALADGDITKLIHLFFERADCGIIITTSSADKEDWIAWLDLGADDCVGKSITPRELLARARAVARRVWGLAGETGRISSPFKIQLREVEFDLAGRTIYSPTGGTISLTSAEFSILKTMATADGKLVSRASLTAASLSRHYSQHDRGIDQIVYNLRQKLAALDKAPFIHSVRGVGYVLSPGNSVARPAWERAHW